MHAWDTLVDGPVSEASMTEKFISMGYSVHVYEYGPGTTFPDHAHGVDKVDGVLSGCFRIRMKGETFDLRAGDYVFVPAGEVHSAEVIGTESVVSLDGVKRP